MEYIKNWLKHHHLLICQNRPTSSPGRFSLALGAGRPAPKAKEKRPGDEVENRPKWFKAKSPLKINLDPTFLSRELVFQGKIS